MSTATKVVSALRGNGIGPEALDPAEAVPEMAAGAAGFEVRLRGAIGGEALDRLGTLVAEAALEMSRGIETVLPGAVGGPEWDASPPSLRPEKRPLQFETVERS